MAYSRPSYSRCSARLTRHFSWAAVLLAGYFAPGSLARHGSLCYLKERLLRLGGPMGGTRAEVLCHLCHSSAGAGGNRTRLARGSRAASAEIRTHRCRCLPRLLLDCRGTATRAGSRLGIVIPGARAGSAGASRRTAGPPRGNISVADWISCPASAEAARPILIESVAYGKCVQNRLNQIGHRISRPTAEHATNRSYQIHPLHRSRTYAS